MNIYKCINAIFMHEALNNFAGILPRTHLRRLCLRRTATIDGDLLVFWSVAVAKAKIMDDLMWITNVVGAGLGDRERALSFFGKKGINVKMKMGHFSKFNTLR